MTLLELPVKELPKRGGWPDEVHDLRFTTMKFIADCAGNEYFHIADIHRLSLTERQKFITREQYEAAIAAQQPVWNGEGLPPVGSKVESFINGDWRLVKVVYVGETGGEYEALVFDVKTTKPAWSDQFRPIRTEADRKRGEAIDALISLGVFTRPVAEKTVYAIAAGKIPGVELTK